MGGRLVAAGAATLLLVAVGVLLAHAGGIGGVRQTVRAAGFWAPVLFVLLQGVVTVAPVPRTVFTVAAGVLFGPVAGVALTVTGTVLAASGAFWLVRSLGRGVVERHTHRAGVAWLQARLERSGLLAVLSLRLIPMMPFPVVNYASGLSGVRFLPYLIGTVLGILPGTVAVVVLGDAAVGGAPHPVMLAVSGVSAIIGLAGAVVAARLPAVPAPSLVQPEPETNPAA